VQTEPAPAPKKTEPPPAPAKTPKPPKQKQTAKAPTTQPAPDQTPPPPAPAKTPKTPKQKQTAKAPTQPAPTVSKTDATGSEGQTEPAPVPLRQQLRQNLETEVARIDKEISELSAAKGRVQRQLEKVNDQLKTATGDERNRLLQLREKLKIYQDQSLGSGKDLGKKWLAAKQLLSLNEKDYFKALTDAAAKRPEYQSVKDRKVDEVFNTNDTKLEVEHIYPRSKIWNLPGFVEKLSWRQQIAVFNYAKNLKLMSKRANLDRSNTPYKSLPRSVWSRYTTDETVVTNWSKLEDEVQRDIENMIKDPSLIPVSD